MNGKISILDKYNDGQTAIHTAKIGKCKYIVVSTLSGGVSLNHAADCEHCHGGGVLEDPNKIKSREEHALDIVERKRAENRAWLENQK